MELLLAQRTDLPGLEHRILDHLTRPGALEKVKTIK